MVGFFVLCCDYDCLWVDISVWAGWFAARFPDFRV